MTPDTTAAATRGAPSAQGIYRSGGQEPGAAGDLASLQALFSALLARIAPNGEGPCAIPGSASMPAPGGDAGNGLPPELPLEPPSGLPPGTAPAAALDPAAEDLTATLEAALALLTQANEEGGSALPVAGPEGVLAADHAITDGSGLLRLAAEIIQAQPAENAAPAGDVEAGAAMLANQLAETDPASADDGAESPVPGGAGRESAPLPPALVMALAAIARGDAPSAPAQLPGENSAATIQAAADGRVPASIPVPAAQQSGAHLQPAPQLVAQGAEPLPQPPVPAGAQQVLHEALTQAGSVASGERASVDSSLGAIPVTAVPAPTGPGAADRPAPVWTLATPMHQAQQWADEVGDRVRWMVGQQFQSAELKITPPDLGTIKVRISVHQDQMSISFSSPSPLVRDTLEEAIPRLRDMMSGSGFDAVDVEVAHEGPDDPGGGPREEAVFAATAHVDDDRPERSETVLSRGSGALDLYA